MGDLIVAQKKRIAEKKSLRMIAFLLKMRKSYDFESDLFESDYDGYFIDLIFDKTIGSICTAMWRGP